MLSIPRKLLIHSAEIRTPLSEDCFGQRLYSESTSLRFIRIDCDEREKTRERDMLNIEAGGSAVLIYDSRNSLPRGFSLKTGQEVLFCGRKYRITDVSELFDEGRLHHTEAVLTEVGT